MKCDALECSNEGHTKCDFCGGMFCYDHVSECTKCGREACHTQIGYDHRCPECTSVSE